MKFIENALAEDNPQEKWSKKLKNQYIKVQLKSSGSQFSKKIPVFRGEHIFPDCEHPSLLMRALEEERFEWEDTTDKFNKLTQYYSTNIQVNRILNKSYLKSAQREFVDKKILFRTSDVMENCKI